MILVTVGTHAAGFPRLVAWMDDIASRLEEPVTIQRGHDQLALKHATSFGFAPDDKFAELVREARCVVGHAGAGTILACFRLGVPLVCVPRRRHLGEAADDHQLELAARLAREGRVRLAEDPATLEALLRGDLPRRPPLEGEAPLVAALRRRLAG